MKCRSDAALTGQVFELIHCREDSRLTVLQEEDDQQRESVVVQKGTGTTGITYTPQCDSITKKKKQIRTQPQVFLGGVLSPVCLRTRTDGDSRSHNVITVH